MKEMEKTQKNIDVILSIVKPPIFWKEKPMVKKQLSVWKINDLKTTIYEINNIELLCKKNSQISKIIFFNFFNKICSKANSFS
jgi:DNA polymerase-3 subunit delta